MGCGKIPASPAARLRNKNLLSGKGGCHESFSSSIPFAVQSEIRNSKWLIVLLSLAPLLLGSFALRSSLLWAGVWDLQQTPATATFYGAHNYDYLGTGIACGDVNGDGQPDLLMTAPEADTSQTIQLAWGMAYLFYGGNLGGVKDLKTDSADFRVIGNRTSSGGFGLGKSASLGDVNGDGKKDLILGVQASAYDSFPDVVVIFGGDRRGTLDLNTRLPDFAIESPGGWDIGTVTTGDVNGDDIIMASPFTPGPNGRSNAGAVYVVQGRQGLIGRRYLATEPAEMTIYGADVGDEMGYQGAGPKPVIYVGDINRDGIGDLVVTAFAADGPGNTRPSCGEVYVFYGGSLPREWDLRFFPADLTVFGRDTASYLDVGLIGDVNGDGYGDLFMGAEGEFEKGAAYLLYGSSPPPRGIRDISVDSMDYSVVGIDTHDLMASILALADVNDDGKQDLLISALFGAGPGNTRRHGGEAYLIFGGNLRGTRNLRTFPPDWTFYGRSFSDYHLGKSLIGGTVTGGRNAEVILVGGEGASGPPGDLRNAARDVHILDLQGLVGVETHATRSGGTPLSTVRLMPNPFASFTTLPGHSSERFALYDISDRKVGVWKGDRIGEGLPAGVYFVAPMGGMAKPLRIVKLG